MYKSIIRPILFKCNPESVHNFVFTSLRIAKFIPGCGSFVRATCSLRDARLEREVFGIKFPNPIGLAAGLDKDAEAFDMLGNMGFGFVEIGTVTPKAQPGNPKPRLFRLPKDGALVNRMGFNNGGVETVVKRLKKKRTSVLIGGNIGKNKFTINEVATRDYEICFEALYPWVDYFVVNVSSPNTPNLRELQDKEPLQRLLSRLQTLNNQTAKAKPILLKIAPDLTDSQLDDIVDIVQTTGIAGIVATNTTISRSGLSYSAEHIESLGAGGLSGRPLRERSTEVIRYIHKKTNGAIPIIGVGGVMTPEDALEKLEAGAALVQIYTSFIYEGPGFVKRINKYLLSKVK